MTYTTLPGRHTASRLRNCKDFRRSIERTASDSDSSLSTPRVFLPRDRQATLYRPEVNPDSWIHFRASATVGNIFATKGDAPSS